jgi:hypothetical protein
VKNLGLSEVVFLSNLIGGSAGKTGLGNKQGAKSYSASSTLTASQSGMFIQYSGASDGTFTLPTASSVGGVSFTIWNNTVYTLTLACSDAYFYGPIGSSAKTKKIRKYQTIEVISDGYNWICHSIGAPADDNVAHFSNGLVLQWGVGSSSGSGARTVTQPLNENFPTKTLFAFAVDVGSGCFSYATGVTSTNLSSFTIYIPSGAIGTSTTPQITGDCGWRWFAIGN